MDKTVWLEDIHFDVAGRVPDSSTLRYECGSPSHAERAKVSLKCGWRKLGPAWG